MHNIIKLEKGFLWRFLNNSYFSKQSGPSNAGVIATGGGGGEGGGGGPGSIISNTTSTAAASMQRALQNVSEESEVLPFPICPHALPLKRQAPLNWVVSSGWQEWPTEIRVAG